MVSLKKFLNSRLDEFLLGESNFFVFRTALRTAEAGVENEKGSDRLIW